MKNEITTILITILFVNLVNSQSNSIDVSHENVWSFGIGVNGVDDSGRDFREVFNISGAWNFETPLLLNAEYYLDNKFSISSALSFNKYKADKLVDGAILESGLDPSYFAIDFSGKYSFRDLLNTNAFEPYCFLGAGYTKIGEYRTNISNGIIQAKGRMTANLGFGANYWMSENWGLNTSFASKFGLGGGVTNQFQFGFGLKYLIQEKIIFSNRG